VVAIARPPQTHPVRWVSSCVLQKRATIRRCQRHDEGCRRETEQEFDARVLVQYGDEPLEDALGARPESRCVSRWFDEEVRFGRAEHAA
jgi:hypothetical protein